MNRSIEEGVSVDRLISDFKVVFHDAERLVKASAGDFGEKAREARERLAASLEAARQNMHQVEDRALRGARATDKAIRDYPYHSTAAAFGLGLLFGIVISR